MNWIQSKIARLRIRRKGYNERRRQEMIRKAWEFNYRARTHYGDNHPGAYDYYCGMENEYRLRAAWYIKKNQIERKK